MHHKPFTAGEGVEAGASSHTQCHLFGPPSEEFQQVSGRLGYMLSQVLVSQLTHQPGARHGCEWSAVSWLAVSAQIDTVEEGAVWQQAGATSQESESQ